MVMGRRGRLLQQILGGRADANIRFEDLCNLLLRFGFDMRTSGSHHVFRKSGVEEKVNLQREGSKAKPYQVRQVRQLILKYRLGG
jgi:predicted RNA binding protein YcfA (HicA-like mRNA interferase family)